MLLRHKKHLGSENEFTDSKIMRELQSDISGIFSLLT